MKTRFPIKAGLVALIAGSALLTGQLYAQSAEQPTADAQVERQSAGKYEHGHHRGGMHKMLRMLDLTETQKTDVKAIVEKYKAQRPEKPSAEVRAANKAQMVSVITNANFDEAKAQELIAANQERKAAKMLQHMKMQNEIYQLLTPEQQAKFTQRIEKQGKKR
ncbi:Spy/CpxP family protein refolding chaperone [Shewanella subflava]|uniref:Spy/CpxP family protein refolding chaperone n=1 Tax=Shewanella subflava TaxID=2986476 RepID=A0ABT3I7U5_9GAMM|nr:Spy/CpxP family protein refolding chaperone [Shewanella subflava]MCW3172078.1 Spy/CpxP family protein refolding chaperone [Shewanella subflava]